MSNASSERMSVFGPTLRFKGELKAQEDIKIEGRIEGTIHHQQRVVVGQKGEVVATVNAAVHRRRWQGAGRHARQEEHQGQSIGGRARQSPRAEREHHRGSKFQWRSHDGVECWVARTRHPRRLGPLSRRRT